MQYNSWLYLLVFLVLTVLFYYLLPLSKRWGALLTGSLIFYILGSHKLIIFLLITAFTIYGSALLMERNNLHLKKLRETLSREERKKAKAVTARQNKQLLALLCIINFGILFYAKYFNFTAQNLNLLFQNWNLGMQLPLLNLLMPLGISYYTLSAISYLTDVLRGTCQAEKNFCKFLLFLFFFPIIVEGPFSRYGQLGHQLYEGHSFSYTNFCFGLQRILWGLLKKVVLADRYSILVKALFNDYTKESSLTVFCGMLLYTFQIYMDFSGCIDIATGSAQLFGIHLEENFKRPFFAVSVNDFWRRWHITLGAWFRDYIFYPISLSKPFQRLSKKSRQHLSPYYAATLPAMAALFAVWLGNGIWHGAEWKYICYGLYYYVIMSFGMLLEPLFLKLLPLLHLNRAQKGYHFFQIIRTFFLVNVGMLIFRAKDLNTFFSMLISMLRFSTKGRSFYHVVQSVDMSKKECFLLLFSVILLLIVGVLQEKGIHIREKIATWILPLRWSIYMGAVLIIICCGAYGPGFGAIDFIYAKF